MKQITAAKPNLVHRALQACVTLGWHRQHGWARAIQKTLALAVWTLGGLLLPLPAWGQAPEPLQLQVANMAQDVAGLQHELGRLGLALEQVAHNQAAFSKQLDALKASLHAPDYVTSDVLQAQKKAILAAVAAQLEALGQQTQQALDQLGAQLQSLHKAQGDKTLLAAKPAASHVKQACGEKQAALLCEDYPKEGLAYTVKKGDTLAKIAQAHHAQVAHIQAANAIQDPTRLAVGKVIFIPVLPEGKK